MIKEERHPQAAKFVTEIDRTAALLAANPFLGAARADGTRGHALTEFPYTIYYVVRSNELVIAAIAHHSRREGYWRKRLKSLGL
ncbi:type II toxin-antitoxin system RelE/ParE family toxin [Longimicrobium sp.]|uniref:type II toxin-antitoxin system RelE/ParE family toxin n=1 Tax=Longimicrobium sp. TaxID=2029185 RepID=UPI002E2EC75F|nr:type II toxin-antitoxin system RelE/ParE family toxin [Longimicrobium sp.]HEX6042311.1 type II toxin-antitoxin system RelE/ParE family toxin [Longimicrobium sp.]